MGFTRPKPVAPRRPGHATHRLPLIFAVTILVPGLVLGFLGLRALLQERQLAEQQVRERVAVIAESTGRQLELDLRDWQQAAEQISLMGPADSARWPDRVRLAVTEPLDPTEWLRDMSEEFQGQVADAGFTIEASIPDALPAIVADRDALTTAVHNLLDNAVKYSRESRTVQMEATATGEELTIAVRDRGAEIRDADRPRIFEKFYRGDGELTDRVKGVGLGLKQLMSSNLKVARAWALKETFMDAFAVRQPTRAERALKEVLAWMSRSRLAPIVRAGRTVRHHFDGVMNAILSGITNATAEAINARIQWLKKQAAGFRSRERFRQAIYFHLGGLDLYPNEARAHSHPNA